MAAGPDAEQPCSPKAEGHMPPPPAADTELTPAEQFAQEVRSKAKWGPAVDVNVRGLMSSGVMAGQRVHIQLKHKEPVYLQGARSLASCLVRAAYMSVGSWGMLASLLAGS